MTDFTLWDMIRNLLWAARWTVGLSLLAFAGGSVLGGMVLVCRTGRLAWLRRLAWAYIELFQGTPLLMQLFLAFFGMALLGVDVPAGLAAAVGLILWSAAFLAEIWRGCVESIAKGQWEAAASLGLGYGGQLRYVILPQAVRIGIPPTVGFSVQIIKGTALTSIIGFVELAKAGTVIANAAFTPFSAYGLVALFYFALCWPLSKLSQRLEQRLHTGH